MGPAYAQTPGLPNRPRFAWDVKNCPWTDGSGNQEGYANAVKKWALFHDQLPNGNSNKIDPNCRGIMLEANLYGRAKDICRSLTQTELTSNDGANKIIGLLYKRNCLSVVSDVYRDFNLLTNLRRGPHETYKDFEMRFSACLAKYNAHADATKINESVSAMMLLANSNIDENQRISVLSAAAPNPDGDNPTNDDFVSAVKYESIAAVLRQCDCVKTGNHLMSHSGHATSSRRSDKFRRRQMRRDQHTADRGARRNLNNEQLKELKARSQCNLCKKYGHWKSDHHRDGSLKPGVMCFDKPRTNDKRPSASSHAKAEKPSEESSLQFGLAVPITENEMLHDDEIDASSSEVMSQHETSRKIESPNVSQTDLNHDAHNVSLLSDANKVANGNDDMVIDNELGHLTSVVQYTEMLPASHLDALFCSDIDMGVMPMCIHNDPLCHEMPDLSLDLEPDLDLFNKTISAGMAGSSYTKNDPPHCDLGPMLDDGAPYSALGIIELKMLRNIIDMDPIPSPISEFKYWQFGSGAHSSAAKPILGSTNIKFKSDQGSPISIRHIIVQGSSPWVIGRNITRLCDIIHINGHYIRLPRTNGAHDRLSLVDYRHHSYVPMSAVAENGSMTDQLYMFAGFSASSLKRSPADDMPWPKLKHLLDRIHQHVCGHGSLSDIKTLLQRNNLWTNETQHYIANVMQNCTHCVQSSQPRPPRKVSLHMMNKQFNHTVFIDHFYLDETRLFHIMDGSTRYSAVSITPSTSMSESILAFQSAWLNCHWIPEVVQADNAFDNAEFREFIESIGAKLQIVPPRRHQKNILEPKHGIVRSIYNRIKSANPKRDARILAYDAIRISNDMYGSSVLSAFELCRGISKPISPVTSTVTIPQELVDAHHNIVARRKLHLIMKSKATDSRLPVKIGDDVQVYIKSNTQKRGKWTNARRVIDIDKQAETVTVSGSRGRTITAAFEDTKIVPKRDGFDALVEQSIEELDDHIQDMIESTRSAMAKKNKCCSTSKHWRRRDDKEPNDMTMSFDDINEHMSQPDFYNPESHNSDSPSTSENASHSQPEHHDNAHNELPDIGDKIDVYWDGDDQYYPGVITEITEDNERIVVYDDGDLEQLDLNDEQWRFTSSANSEPSNPEDDTLQSSSAVPVTSLQRNEQHVLYSMFEYFGNKSFMRHESQGFDQYPLINAYRKEEEVFLENVKVVPRSAVPTDANVIASHTLYKIKTNDDTLFKLKARIAPHGNEDSIKDALRKDCCVCPPVGIRIIMMLASFFGWNIQKADVKSAFLQTGRAARDVYVIPPKESRHKNCLWLLLSAAYGLVNSNAKWQVLSDQVLTDFGLTQSKTVPQLFYRMSKRKPTIVIAKIVDDFLMTGESAVVKQFIEHFNSKFKFGSVSTGPGKLRFYGLDLVQDDDLSSTVSGDDKLRALEPVPMTRIRRRQSDEKFNELENSSFMSLNASLNWLGITASPLCAFYASYLQQRTPQQKVTDLMLQASILKKLKRAGCTTSYPRPPRGQALNVSIVMFADAGRVDDSAQLCYIGGVLLGPLAKGSHFYPITWQSHKSRRPVRSIGAAEILAVGEALDEGKVLKDTVSKLLNLKVPLQVVTDSKDLYTSLSTQRNSVDKSIRSDVNVIRFEFETFAVDNVVWIPGKCNVADVGTKRDSPLTEALLLMMHTGKLSIAFDKVESTSYDQSLG